MAADTGAASRRAGSGRLRRYRSWHPSSHARRREHDDAGREHAEPDDRTGGERLPEQRDAEDPGGQRLSEGQGRHGGGREPCEPGAEEHVGEGGRHEAEPEGHREPGGGGEPRGIRHEEHRKARDCSRAEQRAHAAGRRPAEIEQRLRRERVDGVRRAGAERGEEAERVRGRGSGVRRGGEDGDADGGDRGGDRPAVAGIAPVQHPVEAAGDDRRRAERDDGAHRDAVRRGAREEGGLVGEHAGGAEGDEEPGGQRMQRGDAGRRRDGCPDRIAPAPGEVDEHGDERERSSADEDARRADRGRARVGSECLHGAGGAEAHGGEEHGDDETHWHIVTQSCKRTFSCRNRQRCARLDPGDRTGASMVEASHSAVAEAPTTDPTRGLDATAVATRTRDGRVNVSKDASSRSIWSILRANVFTLFNGIVVTGFLLLLILGRWQDALFGIAAITNAAIGVVQEYRAKRALDRLALLHAPRARVVRDGVEHEIEVRGIVEDDLLILRSGDQVTADCRMIDGVRLEIDESLLTGESEPIDKSPGDRVLSGSIVVGGHGRAIVTDVGDAAFASKLTAEAKRFSLVSSELRSSIDRILKWITWAIFPIMLIVVNANMQAAGGWEHAIETGEWQDAAVASVAAVIAMIPLGLVLMTSIAFAVGAVKLGAHNVLVQELPAVEGLARVDLICLDKTGTLTSGEVRFDDVHALGDARRPDGWALALAWNGAEPEANPTARCLADEFALETALEPVARIEFSSARKWSAVAFDEGAPGTWVLGAPEFVLHGAGAGASAALDRAAELAESGRRTLLLAHSPSVLDAADADHPRLPGGLTAVVLLTFREAVRNDAAATLRYFAEQDVAVRIISGDNPRTVAAV